jgi:hypothetical protein
MIALGGVACALGGAAYATSNLASQPSSHLTVSLLMIGKLELQQQQQAFNRCAKLHIYMECLIDNKGGKVLRKRKIGNRRRQFVINSQSFILSRRMFININLLTLSILYGHELRQRNE